jgi:hypothetical protein
MTKTLFMLILSVLLILIINGCKKDTKQDSTVNISGHIVFQFDHYVDSKPLVKDTLKYINAAGNPYLVSQVMYFISDVTLHKSDGTKKVINGWVDIYYVDNDIVSTMTWNVYDDIPEGKYDSISFIFGINKEKNVTGLFVNPPEVNMAWPGILGGGYHYLMINGKWKDKQNFIDNYNYHLGIGQLYKGDSANVDSIYAYVQNYFNVNLPNSSFTLNKNTTKEIRLIMNIEKWFSTPNIFDFNNVDIIYTMQNQQAMQIMKENGKGVFSIGYIK